MGVVLFFEKLIWLDKELFIFLNGLHSPFWDEIMWAISGKQLWIFLYVGLIFQIIYKYKLKSVPILIMIILLIILSDQISSQVFKSTFHRLRPCHNPYLTGTVHLVNNYCGGQYGFISSHAANTFAFATFIALLFRNKYLTYFMLFWALLVSYSRIYLGVHYPADIFCGALLGSGLAIAIFELYKTIHRRIIKYKLFNVSTTQ
jgi:undecaprenyl-diphosphatase